MRLCGKCKSEKFVKVDNTTGQQFNRIKTGLITIADISRYVCCECGFTEEWIENIEDLKKLEEKYSN